MFILHLADFIFPTSPTDEFFPNHFYDYEFKHILRSEYMKKVYFTRRYEEI